MSALGQNPEATPGFKGNTPTIKAKVRQVVVDVVVTDGKNRPIHGLRREDFSVFEDNVPQQIVSFESHTLPKNRNSQDARTLSHLVPDAYSNAPLENDGSSLNVLLYDVLNTPFDDRPYAQAAILKFLKNRPPASRFAIFVLSDKLHMVQGFTDDSSNHTGPLAVDPSMNGVLARMEVAESMESDYFLEQRIGLTISAFTQIAKFLNGQPGRKNVIWLSGGFPVTIFSIQNPMNPFGISVVDTAGLREAADLLVVGQVAVYPVDTHGLGGALLSEHAIMEEIASDTGGHAFYFTNGLAEAIATSTEDGNNYYTLSYSPSNTNFDGRLRKIRVRSRPAYRLAYRHSYVADDEGVVSQKTAKAPLERLQNAAIRGTPLARELIFAAKVRPEGAPVDVPPELVPHLQKFPVFTGRKNWDGVQVQAYRVNYTFLGGRFSVQSSPDGTYRGAFEFQFAAYDKDDQALLAQWARTDTAYTREQLAKISKGTYEFGQTLQIPSGAVWLRLVVRDVIGDHIGAVEIPLSSTPASMPKNSTDPRYR